VSDDRLPPPCVVDVVVEPTLLAPDGKWRRRSRFLRRR
jgi:hypothetical protein